jgi:hypothetical protein
MTATAQCFYLGNGLSAGLSIAGGDENLGTFAGEY